MSQKEFIAGLDIGTTKTCCVLAEVDLDDGRVDIIGVGSAPSEGLRKGVVVDLDATTESIKSAVEKAQRMAGNIVVSLVVAGVTGEHVSSLNSKGVIAITSSDREITNSDVERVIESSKVIVLPPEREIIHAIPRQFLVDGQDGIKDPVGMSGSRLEVETHIVTGSTSFVDNIVKCIQRAGFAVEYTVLEPIATSESVLFPDEKVLGVALVDFGGGTTDVAVYSNGEICYTAVLPIGGIYVTKDIGIGLRADQPEAERVKIEYGCATTDMVLEDEVIEVTSIGAQGPRNLPREMLAAIIVPRMKEIFTMVKEEIIKSGQFYNNLLPAGVVLTGGGALMPGVFELAEDVLEMPVRLGTPRDVGGLSDTVDSPIFSTAVGLVIYSTKKHLQLHDQQKSDTLKHNIKDIFGKVIKKWFR